MAILGTTLRLYKLYFGKKEYKVTSIKKESQNVWTVCLKPVQNKFSFCPGQFAFVTFLTSRLPKEEHHFTLSSAPTSEEISFTIKEIGDFTSLIKNLKVGDKALVDGPYGIFTNYNLEGPFLFIAGGIGITPVISMLRSMKDKNENTLLIYAAKALDEIPFHSELEKLRSSKWFKIWLCFSEKAPQGKYVFQGHIDKNILKKVANLRKRKIFLVGPEPMMNSVQKDLLDLGVEKENIFSERFALR
jgi:3-phenylpropionate/trans-cinnamate dioxygenase ferredoxin reductase subunit